MSARCEIKNSDIAFEEAWARIVLVTGWAKQADLAKFLGIKSQTVSGVKKRGSFPVEWAFRIAQAYNLSTDWLLTGQGNMHRISLEDEVELSERRKKDGPYKLSITDIRSKAEENPLLSNVVYGWPGGKVHYFGKDYKDLVITAELFDDVGKIKNALNYTITQEHEESFMLLLFSIVKLSSKNEIEIANKFLDNWIQKLEGKVSNSSPQGGI